MERGVEHVRIRPKDVLRPVAVVIVDVEDRDATPRNPHAHVVGVVGGRIDPALLYDVSDAADDAGQLSFRELLVDTGRHDHVHAVSVTGTSDGCLDPGALLDLLEAPPAGVYRLKGTVAIRSRQRVRRYVVNVVGSAVHVATAPPATPTNCLVAIGTDVDVADTRARIDAALQPHEGSVTAAGLRRLQRYRRLSF